MISQSNRVPDEEEDVQTVYSRLSDIDGNRADNINPLLEDGMCWMEWPDEPWSIRYYFSTRGQDNGHIYFWIMKDLSWLQCWYYEGHIFGFLALLWSLFMALKALNKERYDDAFIVLCQLTWLTGNFLWMNGELHDEKYPDEKSTYDARANEAGYMLLTAFCMISAYYVIWVPGEKLLSLTRSGGGREERGDDISVIEKRDRKRKETYEPVDRVYDRISREASSSKRIYNKYPSLLFSSWKHYENVHILLWLGKDTAWNWEWKVMWMCFSIPTIIVGLDFLHKSLFTKRLMIDHAHYCAQFLWVFSNLIWAYGELFMAESRDLPIDFWTFSTDAKKSARWYSTWVLLAAFVPLVVMYTVWIWGTITGKISTPFEIRQRKYSGDFSDNIKDGNNVLEPMLTPTDDGS